MRLKQLVLMPEAELAALDVGVIHHICAQGLPGAEESCLESTCLMLDEMARQIKRRTSESEWMFRQNPKQFQHSHAVFQAMVLTTTIQRDFGVRTESRVTDQSKKGKWADSRSLFLHGLLAGLPGTCSNVPILYAALGRRLGYPLRTVGVPIHQFLRWDDPTTGERFNIECTTLGFTSPTDFHFAIWPPGAEWVNFEGTTWLKSETPRQELASFLIQRAACLNANGRYGEAVDACAWAYRLNPQHRPHLDTLRMFMADWEEVVQFWFPPPRPVLSISGTTRPHSHLPRAVEAAMIRLEVLDDLANDLEFRKIYEPRLRSPEERGKFYPVPARIHVNYRDQSTCEWNERQPLRRS